MTTKAIATWNANGFNTASANHETKIESAIETVLDHSNDIGAICIQETHCLDYETIEARGCLILHHNYDLRKDRPSKKKKGREMRGVAIILSPEFKEAYKNAGSPEPIVTPKKGRHVGRFIGVSLTFQNYNSRGRRVKGELKVFLASAYFPSSDDLEEYEDFLMVTQSLIDKAPSNAIKIIGADVNANVGVRKGEDDGGALGPFGIDKVNEKGELLVNWLE